MSECTRADIRAKRELEVVIDDFGFTGEGYVRLDDGWLSVFGALPGERVRVRLQPGQRSGARRLFADVVEVLESSPHRRDPLCERDAICRGCQLRHLSVDAELRFKVRTVREVIERYAGLGEDEQPDIEMVTPQPIARGDAFRIRSQLSYRRRGDGFSLGLHTPVDEELVPMDDCPALTVPLRRLIQSVSASLSRCASLPADRRPEQTGDQAANNHCQEPGIESIRVASPTHGVGLIDVSLVGIDGEKQFHEVLGDGVIGTWLQQLIEELPDGVGVMVRGGDFRRHATEPRRIRIPIGEWNLEIGYDDWFHATLEPAEQVYQRLMDWIEPQPEQRVLDIGCGTGTIGLMFSERVRHVVGVDINPASIEAAEINAVGHGRENIEFVVGGWEKALRQLAMNDEHFDAATINPMREPLGHRPLAFLDRLGVERLAYLGPSPEASAKDIGQLREMGWTVQRLAAANLHPATYHTMLMALLVRP